MYQGMCIIQADVKPNLLGVHLSAFVDTNRVILATRVIRPLLRPFSIGKEKGIENVKVSTISST